MYQTRKTYIKSNMRMFDMINENPLLLLLLEHLSVDFAIADKTISRLCADEGIPEDTFLLMANLYNGFYPAKEEIDKVTDIGLILRLLKSSHTFYKEDKYPEILSYLQQLEKKHDTESIRLIRGFFTDYFKEVLEHLDYEENVAFPYFWALIAGEKALPSGDFKAGEYREHHTDIETKLTDLKNILLKHVTIQDDLTLRRKLLNSLFELEFDLMIHSLIEEKILLPLVEKVEENRLHGKMQD